MHKPRKKSDVFAVAETHGRCNLPFGYQFVDFEVNSTVERCLKRIFGWRPPPNWSSADWYLEITAQVMCELYEAERDFDTSRDVPFCGFIYERLVARAFTRYRQEWAFASRHASESENPESEEGGHDDNTTAATPAAPYCQVDLHGALASLSDINCWIIEHTFWHERTECELAKAMGISQPAVNKRKRLALEQLRKALYELE